MNYELCLLVHKSFIGQSPPCSSDLITPVTDVESVTDRSETDLVVDNNIQESFKDISCQLSIHLTLIMECAIQLTVRGTLQMQLLLLQQQTLVQFCSLAVLDPWVGHTMDVLSPFISVLCHSD